MKEELVGSSLDENKLKKTWKEVVRTITTKEFATILRWQFQSCKKCIQSCKYVGGKNAFLAVIVSFYFNSYCYCNCIVIVILFT
jgi:hypothetical protein